MRDYKQEVELRTAFIRQVLADAHCTGIVFGNSGGKDSALVGILCKLACENTVGVIMPCASKRNYGEDKSDGLLFAEQFGIETRLVDLTPARDALTEQLAGVSDITDDALKNIAPRLRMATLYAIGQSEGRLVAGTGNRDELFIGYFTKYGDGGVDFNPISDLTVGEVYEFLEYLGAPESIIKKAPSAGLFEGQTDEAEIGISYAAIDKYLLTGEAEPDIKARLDRMHATTAHKRTTFRRYAETND